MSLKFPRCPALAALLSLLAVMTAPPMSAQEADELLEVTAAFVLSADASNPGVLKLHWDIAEDYYLYRGRISVEALDSTVELGTLDLPPGKKKHDQFLGDVEIYHDAVDATLPYTVLDASADRLNVAVRFQGCHEVDPKICYPPYTQELSLSLPAPAAATATPYVAPPTGGLGAALDQLGGSASLLGAQNELPLPPEQAFRFESIADGSHGILARFTMPPGYYLYRDKSHIELADGDGITLGAPHWPLGVQHKDEHFGTTEVFFNEAEIRIPLLRERVGEQRIALEAEFQGCQDGGICYPVMTRVVNLVLPAASAAEMAAAKASFATKDTPTAEAVAQSEEQVFAGGLSGNSRWWTLLLFFGAGLLLAFTPCVLPMIPILSGLIAGAGEHVSTARAFVLSLVYVLATCVVFTIAGVIAGMLGANLQAAFQQPWILWCFAIVFTLLALSMFGFFELQLPSALQTRLTRASNRQARGSLLGVAIMGVLSALIVGPCVAPPLAGAVLYIAQTRDPVFGGLALLLLSLGMGIPLIAFGTAAGKWLPRAGGWMRAVNAVFGVVFLALAIWMLSRILDPLWIMLMTATLLIGCAVYMGTLERLAEGASGWRTLWKALGLVLLLAGAAELLGALAGGRDPLQPLRGIVGGNVVAEHQGVDFDRIKTSAALDRAIAAAVAEGKPLLLDFYADWCVSCKEMERFTLSQPEVMQALAGFALVQADVTANDAADKALLKRFGLFGPPATIFFGTDGKEQRGLRLIGFESADEFVTRVDKAMQP